MGYETRVTEITINRAGEPLFSEMATRIRIEDEPGGGEFVEVSQSGREDGKIAIAADEWPLIREAIDRMIADCRSTE